MKFFTAGIVFLCFLMPINESADAERLMLDRLNRQVRIPDNPQRIVSLAPNITEIIFTIDKGHLVKGVTQYSDYPSEALDLPKVGSYVALDLEKIVALEPDLCIATRDGNPLQTINRLESLGIPIFAVDPRDLNSILETITAIGSLLHAERQADNLVRDMRTRIEKIKAIVAGAFKKPTVFFQIGVNPIVSVGTPATIHELILLAGGENLAEGRIAYPRFSREEIILLAPEIIIVTTMTRGTTGEQIASEWKRWTQIPAVRNQQVHIVDSDLFDRPSPRLVDGLETLAQLIHPELFPKGPE